VKLFLQWIKDYSELHVAIVGAIYNDAGITRGGVWQKLGRNPGARIHQTPTCSASCSGI